MAMDLRGEAGHEGGRLDRQDERLLTQPSRTELNGQLNLNSQSLEKGHFLKSSLDPTY